MPRLLSLGTALAVAAVSFASVSLPGADAATPVLAKKTVHHHGHHHGHHGHKHHGKAHHQSHVRKGKAAKVLTDYVVANGLASGTSIDGGLLPVQSGPTGSVVLGCPSTGGATHTTTTAAVDLAGGAIHVGATEGKVYSTQTSTGLNAWSTEHIAAITLSLPTLIPGLDQAASLTIDGVNTAAHAWHDSSGFHASTGGSLADISVSLAGQTFKLPLPTQQLQGLNLDLGVPGLLDLLDKVPGLSTLTDALENLLPQIKDLTLATISLGTSGLVHNSTGARADNSGIVITVPATKTVVRVSRSYAALRTVRTAMFNGTGNLVDGSLLNGIVTLGANVRQYMPCTGTNGKGQTLAIAALPLNLPSGIPGLDLGVGSGWQQSGLNVTNRTAYAHQQVKLADLNLAGQIHISALTAQVNAYRTKGKVVTDTKGSNVASITVAGQSYTLQQLNGFEIPGVLKIATGVTRRLKVGIDYIALQVTLLGGTGGTINIGHVQTRILPWR
jgi:hypothetical protein